MRLCVLVRKDAVRIECSALISVYLYSIYSGKLGTWKALFSAVRNVRFVVNLDVRFATYTENLRTKR
jgi:hypothetical protein